MIVKMYLNALVGQANTVNCRSVVWSAELVIVSLLQFSIRRGQYVVVS